MCLNCRARSSLAYCVLRAVSGHTLMCMHTHILAMLSLCCSVSKFLPRFSKYCYFNYFRHVWSFPAVGFELPVLTQISGYPEGCRGFICSASNSDNNLPTPPLSSRECGKYLWVLWTFVGSSEGKKFLS